LHVGGAGASANDSGQQWAHGRLLWLRGRIESRQAQVSRDITQFLQEQELSLLALSWARVPLQRIIHQSSKACAYTNNRQFQPNVMRSPADARRRVSAPSIPPFPRLPTSVDYFLIHCTKVVLAAHDRMLLPSGVRCPPLRPCAQTRRPSLSPASTKGRETRYEMPRIQRLLAVMLHGTHSDGGSGLCPSSGILNV
jgi:hypothetical protein